MRNVVLGVFSVVALFLLWSYRRRITTVTSTTTTTTTRSYFSGRGMRRASKEETFVTDKKHVLVTGGAGFIGKDEHVATSFDTLHRLRRHQFLLSLSLSLWMNGWV